MNELKRDISELNCDGLLIHPQSPQLVKFLEEKVVPLRHYSQKLEVKKGFSKASVYRYILLMYSPNSPIRNMMSLDWWEQKFEACSYSGFELKQNKVGDTVFDEKVLEMILGNNDVVNDMIIAFVGYLGNSKWDYTIFLKESMLGFTRDALGNKSTSYKNAADYKKLFDDYMRITSEMSHEREETQNFVDRFYYQIEQRRLAVQPEDYTKILNDGADLRSDSPYGINYQPEPIKFIGDTMPDEN